MVPMERSRFPFSGLDAEIEKNQFEQPPQGLYPSWFGSSLQDLYQDFYQPKKTKWIITGNNEVASS